MSDWMFTSIDEIKSLLSSKSNIVNCVNNDINLENTPPIILNSSTQDVLGYLANYVSEKDFVLLRRWENGDDFYDEVYATSESSKNFRSDEFIDEFPGSENMDESLMEDDYYNPDCFYVYERKVFESLNLKNNKLELEVENYTINPLI